METAPGIRPVEASSEGSRTSIMIGFWEVGEVVRDFICRGEGGLDFEV